MTELNIEKDMVDWEFYDESWPVKMKPGFELYLRKGCEYSRKRFVYKVTEAKELDFLEKFDFSELVCIDIGSNIGYWSVYLGAKLKARQVHGFEPDPITFSILEKNVVHNKIEAKIIINPCAISEVEKTINLYLISENSGNNRPNFVEGRESIQVKSVSIDQYIKTYQINKVDFIKIDIEGGETAALDGSAKTISRDKPVLMLEFVPRVVADRCYGLKERLLNLMEMHNMSLYFVDNHILLPIKLDQLDQYSGNLFVSTDNSWLCNPTANLSRSSL